ncbi:TVG0148825 [Thermoplasma volcanium GSS1]|uniref:TVG0148825 protein n=1 Tax=Thermoplasma volcanium (strain ATCC 51530 / DSM 4299 / JCM 9571 / NBRC 15438 / GSS1) TaxID=273116 RepID=Q97CF8_THEVO|nr:TVG0148825 [Thermoplasma volcanium GSS1]
MLEASSRIREDEFGRPSVIHEVDRAQIILSKEMFDLSNRKAAYLMPLMGMEYEVSYKTVERIYSDDVVPMIMHNHFVLSVKKRGIDISNACRDRTGYSLTVSDHHRSVREKLGESVKHGKYRYSFAIMDLKTRMYIGYASFVRSESDAYQKASRIISDLGIQINSVRLNK